MQGLNYTIIQDALHRIEKIERLLSDAYCSLLHVSDDDADYSREQVESALSIATDTADLLQNWMYRSAP